MREALFVKRNADKWRAMEQNPSRDPDELTNRFMELTDDLSYAQTFYPNSDVTRYLNGLTGQMHRGLMQNKRADRSRLRTFWRFELPLSVPAVAPVAGPVGGYFCRSQCTRLVIGGSRQHICSANSGGWLREYDARKHQKRGSAGGVQQQ